MRVSLWNRMFVASAVVSAVSLVGSSVLTHAQQAPPQDPKQQQQPPPDPTQRDPKKPDPKQNPGKPAPARKPPPAPQDPPQRGTPPARQTPPPQRQTPPPRQAPPQRETPPPPPPPQRQGAPQRQSGPPAREAQPRPPARRLPDPQQQQRVGQQQQRLTQYDNHLDQQQRLASQHAAQLQQQKRSAQYSFQLQYTARLRDQQLSLLRSRDYNYRDDPYFYTPDSYRYLRGGRYYQTNDYGASVLRQAVNFGYEEGFEAGRADRQDRWGFDYQNSYPYMDANFGYTGFYVDRDDYNHYFREGFRRGYDDGYYGRYQYGAYASGRYVISAPVLSVILRFETIR